MNAKMGFRAFSEPFTFLTKLLLEEERVEAAKMVKTKTKTKTLNGEMNFKAKLLLQSSWYQRL